MQSGGEEQPVDLLFLDIEFRNTMDGIQLGKTLRTELKNERTQIVYISEIETYAMQLFQNRPFDFLIKPIKQKTIDRVMQEYTRLFGKQNGSYFEYKTGKIYHQIAEEEIMYFQSDGRKIQLITNQKIKEEFYGKMDEVKEKVNENKFWYIHKSYLVNRSYISSFNAMGILLINGTELPVSRTYWKEIQRRILEERSD